MAAAEVGILPHGEVLPRDPILPQDLVFVDLETTGGNVAYHRITEVGIVRRRDGVVVEEWSALVNPQCLIPPYIESFTGITNAMVADAPCFGDIAALVLEKLTASGAPVFVAHNARFDYSFLRAEFRRLEMRFSAKVLCTVKLSRRLFPHHHRHNLDVVMERHGVVCSARHRALGDARVLSDLWSVWCRELAAEQLADAVHAVLGAQRLPAHLPPELADELPEGPGVYRFYGEGDVLLYIGKSVSLRTRVLSHFTAEHTESKERRLAAQVRRVDWLETAGDLGAQLQESQWIKVQRPLYNKRLKSQAHSYTLLAGDAPSRVTLAAIDELEAGRLADCFGVFHSQKDARKALGEIARAQLLCLKTLGLEESAGSCFAYQLGRCKGACVGKEPPALHHMRLKMALSALKLKPWPFPGRIAIREGRDEFVVVDHWAYLGTARCEEELAELAGRRTAATFDVDVYRILQRHLARRPDLAWHALRSAEQ